MSEITDYLGGYLNELNNYMERLNSDRLSRKDRKIFLEMSSEYYDVFKESAGENIVNEFPGELLDAIAAFNDNIIGQEDNGQELANQHHQTIVSTANDYIERVECSELQFGIFQKDAEILRLQEEKQQMMQNLVDLEIKRNGQISPETIAILDERSAVDRRRRYEHSHLLAVAAIGAAVDDLVGRDPEILCELAA